MNRPRCETCLAFDPKGECHNRSPILIITTNKSAWPTVTPTDWCMEYQPDIRRTALNQTWKGDQAVTETLSRRYPHRPSRGSE